LRGQGHSSRFKVKVKVKVQRQNRSTEHLTLVIAQLWFKISSPNLAIGHKYEGHPINKLLNSIVLLIVKTGKIRDIRFVGNLFQSICCEFYYDDVTVTSVIHIKYGDVTAESIPQETGFCRSFTLGEKKLSTNAIHSEMRPVYGDKSFTRPVTHFGVSNLLRVEKVLGLLRRNDLAAVCFGDRCNNCIS